MVDPAPALVGRSRNLAYTASIVAKSSPSLATPALGWVGHSPKAVDRSLDVVELGQDCVESGVTPVDGTQARTVALRAEAIIAEVAVKCCAERTVQRRALSQQRPQWESLKGATAACTAAEASEAVARMCSSVDEGRTDPDTSALRARERDAAQEKEKADSPSRAIFGRSCPNRLEPTQNSVEDISRLRFKRRAFQPEARVGRSSL